MHEGFRRFSPIYAEEYVTMDTGTGIVHSAPAYGVDDFLSCKRHGMKDDEILNPVMANGHYASTLPLFGGMMIWDASKLICNTMQEAGTLFNLDMMTHSYMHCWRHKTPIVYRATSQWFAGMDVKPNDTDMTLRETALKGVEETTFYPDWGKARLQGMIANRPDWTLSRQRQWGVPMAFFVHKETGELHPRMLELLEEIAKRVEKEGIEAWQTLDPKELLGDEADQYEKNKDTLDVWFDSGRDAPDRAARLACKGIAFPCRSVPRRFRPAQRLVPFLAFDLVHARWMPSVQDAPDAWFRRRRGRQKNVEVDGQRHRPAKSFGHTGRRHFAPVGRRDRLLRRTVDFR